MSGMGYGGGGGNGGQGRGGPGAPQGPPGQPAPYAPPGSAGYGNPYGQPAAPPGWGGQPYSQPYPQSYPYPQQQPYPQPGGMPQPYPQPGGMPQPHPQQVGLPGAAMGLPPGTAGAVAQRVQFEGRGLPLLGAYIVYGLLPLLAVFVVAIVFFGAGAWLEGAGGRRAIAIAASSIGSLVYCIGLLALPALFLNKFLQLRYGALTLNGEACAFKGDMRKLMRIVFVTNLLGVVTFGIYLPWGLVRLKKYAFENTTVSGRPGRLTFDGEPSRLLTTMLVGTFLLYLTLGLSGSWFANDLFAYTWENTKLDGRPFGFRKAPGEFFPKYLLAVLWSYLSLGLYVPWAICTFLRWEAEHVT